MGIIDEINRVKNKVLLSTMLSASVASAQAAEIKNNHQDKKTFATEQSYSEFKHISKSEEVSKVSSKNSYHDENGYNEVYNEDTHVIKKINDKVSLIEDINQTSNNGVLTENYQLKLNNDGDITDLSEQYLNIVEELKKQRPQVAKRTMRTKEQDEQINKQTAVAMQPLLQTIYDTVELSEEEKKSVEDFILAVPNNEDVKIEGKTTSKEANFIDYINQGR